ncbi:MAG: dTDP-4-dehydrorhamnose reductase [Saprospiraceae bacterium]
MPTLLVTGANGQLGQALRHLSRQWPQWTFLFTDREELDITDGAAVEAYFGSQPIDFCINAAGYTAVDRAEQEPEMAHAINVEGTELLARACAFHQAALIHVSTDYVYHSSQNTPFEEDDPVMPQNVYARTKREGEVAALQHCPRALVLRTSWVYSPFGANFLLTMLRLGRQRPELRVVYDQVGTPTSAFDLAGAILHITDAILSGKVEEGRWTGIFNYSPEGVTSWFDFAVAILKKAGISTPVRPIRTIDYPTPAARPPYSVMAKEKIKTVFGLSIPHWEEGLDECMEWLANGQQTILPD